MHESFSQELSRRFYTQTSKTSGMYQTHSHGHVDCTDRWLPSLSVPLPAVLFLFFSIILFSSKWWWLFSQCFYPLMYSSASYYLLLTMYKACPCWTSLTPITWFDIFRVYLLLDWGSRGLGWKTPLILRQCSDEIFTYFFTT